MSHGILQKRLDLCGIDLVDGKTPTFKVGNLPDTTPITIAIKQIINLNAIEYASQFLPRNICDVDFSSATSLVTTKNGHHIYLLDGRKWLLPKGVRTTTNLHPINVFKTLVLPGVQKLGCIVQPQTGVSLYGIESVLAKWVYSSKSFWRCMYQ